MATHLMTVASSGEGLGTVVGVVAGSGVQISGFASITHILFLHGQICKPVQCGARNSY